MLGVWGGAGIRVAGLLTLSVVIAVTAAAGQPPAGSPVPFATIAAGKMSGIRTPLTLVIHNRAEWFDLWHRVAGPRATPPVVDFRRDMVAAVFAGKVSEPTAVAIRRIVRTSDRLVIWYTVSGTRPPVDGGEILSSSPFHIVKLARSALPVEFSQAKTPQLLHRLP